MNFSSTTLKEILRGGATIDVDCSGHSTKSLQDLVKIANSLPARSHPYLTLRIPPNYSSRKLKELAAEGGSAVTFHLPDEQGGSSGEK